MHIHIFCVSDVWKVLAMLKRCGMIKLAVRMSLACLTWGITEWEQVFKSCKYIIPLHMKGFWICNDLTHFTEEKVKAEQSYIIYKRSKQLALPKFHRGLSSANRNSFHCWLLSMSALCSTHTPKSFLIMCRVFAYSKQELWCVGILSFLMWTFSDSVLLKIIA